VLPSAESASAEPKTLLSAESVATVNCASGALVVCQPLAGLLYMYTTLVETEDTNAVRPSLLRATANPIKKVFGAVS
jgi:hypothetical protein